MNKIMLIGNLGRDPEIKEIAGTKVANATLAVTERGYTKRDGSKVAPLTTWFSMEAWGALAEILRNYSHKGDKLYVEGKFMCRRYADKNNIEREAWTVKVEEIELLSPRREVSGATGGNAQGDSVTASIGDLPF